MQNYVTIYVCVHIYACTYTCTFKLYVLIYLSTYKTTIRKYIKYNNDVLNWSPCREFLLLFCFYVFLITYMC